MTFQCHRDLLFLNAVSRWDLHLSVEWTKIVVDGGGIIESPEKEQTRTENTAEKGSNVQLVVSAYRVAMHCMAIETKFQLVTGP